MPRQKHRLRTHQVPIFCKYTKKVADVMKVYKLLSYKLTHRDGAFTMKQILMKNGWIFIEIEVTGSEADAA
jgi:hypothetical protein